METAIAQLQRRAIEFATSGNFGPDSLAANLELARLAPDNEGAWTRLSRCYMEGGQLDEATGALESVLAVNPRNSIARSLKIEVNKRRVSLLPVEPKVKPSRARAAKRVRAEDERGRRARLARLDFARDPRSRFVRIGAAALLEFLESTVVVVEPAVEPHVVSAIRCDQADQLFGGRHRSVEHEVSLAHYLLYDDVEMPASSFALGLD